MIAGIVATGGLHLDGVADTVDGFGAGMNRESILRIMKDERLGVYGVSAIVLILYLKILATKTVLQMNHTSILILAPAISRMAIACSCAPLPYARQEGTGKIFAHARFIRHCLPSLIATTALTLVVKGRRRSCLLITLSVLLSASILIYSRRKIHGSWRIGGLDPPLQAC